MRLPRAFCLALPFFLAAATLLVADGPRDNNPETVRPVPPKGVAVAAGDAEALRKGVAELDKEVAELARRLKAPLRDLLPDVEVMGKAVRYALELDEFHNAGQVQAALGLLALGRKRANLLRAGQPTWRGETGLVVRGYRSKIDGSAQPYGLLVPASYRPGTAARHRLDVWLHGRGETLSEVAFLADRLRNRGAIAPRDAFVLHPYGRYSNAFKFAGETDVLEALAHAKANYRIDDDRVVMRGFSMGGAGCWQFAVHYPDRWAAAAPGAGFCETEQFLKEFQGEKLAPTGYERKLWRLYDCPGYAANLFNLPVVAYSGEIDRQKQAADVMEKALGGVGIPLVHLIGPKTGHGYHPVTKVELDRRIDRLAARGRTAVPPSVHLHTFTLRYNRSYWVRIDGLARHWERASVEAVLGPVSRGAGGQPAFRTLAVNTSNVTAFSLLFDAGDWPADGRGRPSLRVDRTAGLLGPAVASDRSWSAHFRKKGDAWELVASTPGEGLAKRHGLQGPIDDAFMDSFLMVRPTGKPLNARVGDWANGEMAHAVTHWRKHFRGDARVKADNEVSKEDVAGSNLVLWGDPSSNALLAKVLPKLPVRWDARGVVLGEKTYDAGRCVPVLVYPNPLNPKRYVVLNSGFTFREYDYLNNARQTPKLPDYAVVDVSTPPTSQHPGKVLTAGFFNEQWALPKD
jgi:pimeloyl-ACP methyl ester carboxylesterase